MRPALHVFACILGFAWPSLASAETEVLKTSAGSPVHWTHPEVSLALQSTAPSRSASQEAVERALERAAETWNAVAAGQPHFHLALGEEADVIIAFCRGRWHGDTIDLGRSQFTASVRDGSVSAATVEINECDHSFSAPDAMVADGFDLQSVITHELGHVLGLGHSTNSMAVMHPNGSGGAHVRRPNVDDQTALALLYFGRFSLDERAAAEGQATAIHAGGTEGRNTSTPAKEDEPRAPERLPVLSLTASGGKQVMVYTCEPTLLPPFGSAEKRSKRSAPR
jgi:hypothetical protein